MMTSTGTCMNARPANAPTRMSSEGWSGLYVFLERIECPKAFGNRQVHEDEHDGHHGKRRGQRDVAGGSLLHVHHHADEIPRRTDHAWDDVVAERQRKREHRSRGDAGDSKWQPHVAESMRRTRPQIRGSLQKRAGD